MNRAEYWEEAASYAFEGVGSFEVWAALTKEQRAAIGKSLETSAECQSEAFYTPPSPEPREIDRLKAELRKEQSEVVCPKCQGRGTYFHQGPYHSASGACFNCRGDGKVLP